MNRKLIISFVAFFIGIAILFINRRNDFYYSTWIIHLQSSSNKVSTKNMVDADLLDIFMKNNKSLFDCTESENNVTNIRKELTELLLFSLQKNST